MLIRKDKAFKRAEAVRPPRGLGRGTPQAEPPAQQVGKVRQGDKASAARSVSSSAEQLLPEGVQRLNDASEPYLGVQVSPPGAPLRFQGYTLRGLWVKDARYAPLRNAAWFVRNARVGQVQNPAALRLVIHEACILLNAGESLIDVLEAYGECLLHP